MGEFYKVGETITAPEDIKYLRQVTRNVRSFQGAATHYVTDKVFANTEGAVQNIFTDAKKTVLTVKFSGHRQHVAVIIKGEAHAQNPLVSALAESPLVVNTEPLIEGEATDNPTTEPPTEPYSRGGLS